MSEHITKSGYVNKNTWKYSSKEMRISNILCEALFKDGKVVPLTDEQKVEHKTNRFRAVNGKGAWEYQGSVRDKMGKYITMTDTQKSKFVELVRNGVCKAISAENVGVTYRIYLNSVEADPDFKDAVAEAVLKKVGALEDIIYSRGLDHDDLKLQMAVLEQYRVNEERKNNRRATKSRLDLQSRELEAKRRAINHVVSQSSGKLDFSCLTNEELDRYSQIYSKMNRKEPISQVEKIEYANLSIKIASSGSADINEVSNDVQSLNQIENISQSDVKDLDSVNAGVIDPDY